MDSYNNYEQEIDLKDLMFAVLRKWRPIIVVAIVFAILLGAFKVMKGIGQLSDEEYVKKNQETYQANVEQYESTKTRLEREIKNLQDNISSQQEYKEKSILMNINPYDEYVSTATLYIATDYQIMPGMVYQNPNTATSILRAYMSIAQNGEMYNYVLGRMKDPLGMRYLKELVKLDPDYNNNMMTITVMADTQKRATDVMRWIMDSIENSHESVAVSIADHEMHTVDQSEFVTVDLDLEQQQKDFSNSMVQLETSLKDKTKELSDLKEPKNELLSKTSVVKSSIKYAILGGVLGGFMAVFFICVAFLMSDKLVNGKELRRRYGLMVLGTFKRTKKKRAFAFVDRWLDKMEGVTDKEMEDGQTFEVIAANAVNYMEGVKHVLLVGTAEKGSLEKVQSGLSSLLSGVEIAIGGNLSREAQAIKEVASCDAVVIVEKRNKSLFAGIEHELDLVKSLDKKVVGAVVF